MKELNRTLGLKLAIIFVIGNIIGSGVYKKAAPMAVELNSASLVLLCWLVGGLITLAGALCSAELAGMLAETGGEVVYFKKIYNRFFAFLFGWTSYTAIKTGTAAALAYIFTQSLNAILPLPSVLTSYADINIFGIFYPFADLNIKLVAILIVLFLTYFNTLGIRTGMALSTSLLIMVLTGISIIVIFGLSSKHSQLSDMISTSSDTFHLSSFFTALLSAFFAYEGWNSVGIIAGEIKEPNRNIPRSIVIGVCIVILIYLMANATYLSLLSMPMLQQVYESKNQIAAIEAVRVFWGSHGATLISVLVLVTTLGCLHATIISNARIYYALANAAMFFPKVGTINRYKVPATSLWFQGIWAMLLIMSGTFDQITDMAMFAAFMFYGATALGVIILRIKMPHAHRPYRVWAYPITPALFVLFSAALTINTIASRPREAGICVVLIMAGIPLYFYFRRSLTTRSNNIDSD